MKLISLIGCGVLLAGMAGTCLADGGEGATTVPQILQMQHALRTKLDSRSGEYARLDDAAIRKMEAAQDRVFRLLDGVTSVDQLNSQQKVDLSNSLDEVKATLLAEDGNRVICHVEQKTGTHLTQRRCETVSSRQKNVDESRKFMMDHPDHIQQHGH